MDGYQPFSQEDFTFIFIHNHAFLFTKKVNVSDHIVQIPFLNGY